MWVTSTWNLLRMKNSDPLPQLTQNHPSFALLPGCCHQRCKWVMVPVKAIWFTTPANMAVDSLFHLFGEQILKIFNDCDQFSLLFDFITNILVLATAIQCKNFRDCHSHSCYLQSNVAWAISTSPVVSNLLWGLEYTSTNACQSENNRHTKPVGAYNDVFSNTIYTKGRVNTKHEVSL